MTKQRIRLYGERFLAGMSVIQHNTHTHTLSLSFLSSPLIQLHPQIAAIREFVQKNAFAIQREDQNNQAPSPPKRCGAVRLCAH